MSEYVKYWIGNPEPWVSRLTAAAAKQRELEGQRKYFRSPDTMLCNEQIKQSAEGRKVLIFVCSIYGWTLRYQSGLQNRAIYSRTGDFDISQALQDAIKFVENNPRCHQVQVDYSCIKAEAARNPQKKIQALQDYLQQTVPNFEL